METTCRLRKEWNTINAQSWSRTTRQTTTMQSNKVAWNRNSPRVRMPPSRSLGFFRVNSLLQMQGAEEQHKGRTKASQVSGKASCCRRNSIEKPQAKGQNNVVQATSLAKHDATSSRTDTIQFDCFVRKIREEELFAECLPRGIRENDKSDWESYA